MSTHRREEQQAFHELMEGVRQGDPEAVRELVEAYGEDVARFVRRYRARELRSKFDLEDYVQAVWKSFFRSLQMLRCDDTQELRGLLFRLAHNEAVGMNLHFLRTQRNDVRREVSLEELSRNGASLESPEAPPWKQLDCQDEIEMLLKKLRHRLGRQLVQRLRDGYTQKEVARDLNVSEKTVGRVIALIRLRADTREQSS